MVNRIHRSRGAALVAALLAGALGPAAAGADGSEPDVVPGELIVRYERGLDAGDRADLRDDAGATKADDLPLARTELVSLERSGAEEDAAVELERRPGVDFAEPNGVLHTSAVPNDPLFVQSWGLSNLAKRLLGAIGVLDADIDAPEAWDLARGGRTVPVAIVDSGIDYAHPDLAQNIWVSPREGGANAFNGRDDDRNGFVDDSIGWDFVDGDAQPADPVAGHGTLVAGIAGARGNNGIGVAGVEWDAAMMALRACDNEGNCSNAAAMEAVDYAATNGARVVNASFGGDSYSQGLEETIRAAQDQLLFVTSAGNNGDSNDRRPQYPCNDNAPNIICVGATDASDQLAGFSNFGTSTVDIAAPGKNIQSTFSRATGESYVVADGTSAAAPYVAGAAALLWSTDPSQTPAVVRQRLLSGADVLPSLKGLIAGAARLNIARALDLDPPSPQPPRTEITRAPARKTKARRVRFGFSASVAASFTCRLDNEPWRRCFSPVRTARLGRGRHVFRVRAADASGLTEVSPPKSRFRVSD